MSGWLARMFVLVALLLVVSVTAPVRADTFNVGCDSGELADAIDDANTNGEADTMTLAAGCTYTLSSQLEIEADGGNLLTIEGNGATISGGGSVRVLFIAGGANVALDDVTITEGDIGPGAGGGIFNAGTVTLTNSTVSDSEADFGGGILNDGGTVTLTNSMVSGNTADRDSGGILNDGGTVTLTNSTVTGNEAVLGGGIANNGTVTLTGSMVSGNIAEGAGGGILNNGGTVTLTNSMVSDNEAEFVGGILSDGGTVTLTNSTVSGNTADRDGGGISNGSGGTVTLTGSMVSGNEAFTGGGILNDGGTVTLTNSTVSGNEAGLGAGIASDGGTVTLTNSTVSGNEAFTGGGIFSVDGTVRLTNSTVNGNGAGDSGGGINNNTSTLVIANSIVAGSTGGGDCVNNGGSVTVSFSLVEDGSCLTAGVDGNLDGDPGLGALTGSPGYHPLLPGSPAIDAGSNALIPGGLTTDQRGAARIVNGVVDMGAFEFSAGEDDDEDELAPTTTFNCDRVEATTDGALTASGATGNVTRDGVSGSAYCRVIAQDGTYLTAPAEIGNIDVINQGVAQAVNVFGLLDGGTPVVPFDTPVRLCLRGSGQVLFLSAAEIPPTPQGLESIQEGEYTCVDVPGSGVVALVGGSPAPTATASGHTLSDCTVTVRRAVRLRAEPNTSSAILAVLPFETTYTAVARVDGWYRVVWQDTQGWVSAEFVTPSGACG